MGTLTSFFGGGGGGVFLPHFALTAFSGTWVADLDGQVCVHVIGGGGAGISSNDGTGGAAGGYTRKIFDVVSGDTFTYTTGRGGRSSSQAGLSSSFTNSSSITLTANGGSGGSAGTDISPTGGTASGGDVNVTGGSAGSRASGNQRTGGGAVGIFELDGGTGYSSGNVTTSSSTNHLTTGGAGVGGRSASVYGISTGQGGGSGGGGSGGPSLTPSDDNYRGTNVDVVFRGGPALISKPETCKNLFRFIPDFGKGGTTQILFTSSGKSASSEPAGIGGGGASASFRADGLFSGQDGGPFGGGGAGGDSRPGGNGGWGGGGGAGFAGTQVINYDAPGGFGSVTLSGGLGGPGIIFVEYLSA